jgi:hypothetical protein
LIAVVELQFTGVFIELGGNDSKLVNRVHLAAFEQDYHELVKSFAQLPSHPRIILLLPLPSFVKDTAREWDAVIVSQIIPRIRQVAYEERVEVLDMHSPIVISSWKQVSIYNVKLIFTEPGFE